MAPDVTSKAERAWAMRLAILTAALLRRAGEEV